MSLMSGVLWRGTAFSRPLTVSCQQWTFTAYGVHLRQFDRSTRTLVQGVLELMSSDFWHLFKEGPAEAIYAGTLCDGLSQTNQGKWLQEWAKQALQKKNPEAQILDPEPGTRCNGWRRSLHQAPYDFLMDGRRIEVKSARLRWSSGSRAWYVRFWSVRLLPERSFDDLYLVIVSPSSIFLIKHDLDAGLLGDGQRTEAFGHTVLAIASRHASCWKGALKSILSKLCEKGSCEMVAQVHLGDQTVQKCFSLAKAKRYAGQAPLDDLHGIPMGNMSAQKRGLRIQAMGLAIDQKLHPNSRFGFIEGNRGSANGAADWVRDGAQVELKASSMHFANKHRVWRCCFRCIKPGFFDDLWLAIYSPLGVKFYRSKSAEMLSLSTTGAGTRYIGYQLTVQGPHNEPDPRKALQVIEDKLMLQGCELVAMVHWDKRT